MAAAHPLRAAREACGLTRPELALRAGISARHVEAVEMGQCGASAATWRQLERALVRAAAARIADVERAVGVVARLDAAAANEAGAAAL